MFDFVSRPSPELTFRCETKKAQDDVLVYLNGGIAKRLLRNKQSTPTPYRISIPLVGEWICDKHERLLTALSFVVLKFGDFR